MKVAILGDIHSNFEALQVVLEDIRGRGMDAIYCIGDVVGYGADPQACVDLVMKQGIVCVAGNHDYATVDQTALEYFNTFAREAILWTRDAIGDEQRQFLKDLPLVRDEDGFTLVHSSLDEPGEWNYIFTGADARKSFECMNRPILFVGHSHIPQVFIGETRETPSGKAAESFVDKIIVTFASRMKVHPQERYIINVGSVGQPRDGDVRACYAYYDIENAEVHIVRVPYSFEKTGEKIIAKGLHPFLAMRLTIGR